MCVQVMGLVAQRHRQAHQLSADAPLLVVQLVDETPVAAYMASRLRGLRGDDAATQFVVDLNTTYAR